MKKALSVLLAMLMLVSLMGVAVSAEGETVKVTFKAEGAADYVIDVIPGEKFTDTLLSGDNLLPTPSKASVVEDGKVVVAYEFIGWADEATGKVFGVTEIPAAAADTVYVAKFREDKIVKVKFYLSTDDMDKDKWLYSMDVRSGVNFVGTLQSPETALPVPTKNSDDTYNYTFNGWELYTKDSSGSWSATGTIRYTGNIPAAEEDVCWVATFAKETIKESQTFWSFVQSVFARINAIFEYFAEVFKGIFNF